MKKQAVILLSILAIACNSNTIFEKPKDLISEEEMVLLLTDLYIATAAKSYANKQDDKNIDYTFIVFEKYGIDSARFKRSNFYYTTKIDDYDKIYLQVQANIKTLKEKQTALIKVRDSIKRDSVRAARKAKKVNDSLVKAIKKRDKNNNKD